MTSRTSLHHSHLHNHESFKSKVLLAVKHMNQILGTNRNFVYPADSKIHTYEDKYLLAEATTKTALVAVGNCLDTAFPGQFWNNVFTMRQWLDADQTITLKMQCKDTCTFLTTKEYETTSKTKAVTSHTGFFGTTYKKEHYTKTTVIEDHYTLTTEWAFVVYRGDEPDHNIALTSGKGTSTYVQKRHMAYNSTTQTKEYAKQGTMPYPASSVEKEEIDLTWFIQCMPSSQKTELKQAEVVGEVVVKDTNGVGQSTSKSLKQQSTDDFQCDPDVMVIDLVDSPQASLRVPTTPQSYSFAPHRCHFTIDRSDESCHTPTRNIQMTQILQRSRRLIEYVTVVGDTLMQKMNKTNETQGLNFPHLVATAVNTVVVPVAATFVFNDDQDTTRTTSDAGETKEHRLKVTLSPNDLEHALSSHVKQLYDIETATTETVMANTATLERGSLIDKKNVQVNIGFKCLAMVLQQHYEAIMTIESMLYAQLNAAIGKHVTADDFNEYMDYHYRTLLAKKYQPKGFACSIRQPMASPVGELSIVNQNGTQLPINTIQVTRSMNSNNNITTTTAHSTTHSTTNSTTPHTTTHPKSMSNGVRFPLNSSVDIHMNGTQTLHAFIANKFEGARPPSFAVQARARQFSSFILLLGRYPSPDLFLPEAAIIVRNKDDVLIPLISETIPTAKEFKKAVKSMSPEQQRFANQYRGMQMGKTLFALVTVQIKPNLEHVLNLKPGSLTKEIHLTNNLMQLLIDYQIPPDMMSHNKEEEQPLLVATTTTTTDVARVARVKTHVKELLGMLEEEKRLEVEAARKIAEKALRAQMKSAVVHVSIDGVVHTFDRINIYDGNVHALKSKIMSKMNVAFNSFQLIHHGTPINETHTFKEYQLTPNCECVLQWTIQKRPKFRRLSFTRKKSKGSQLMYGVSNSMADNSMASMQRESLMMDDMIDSMFDDGDEDDCDEEAELEEEEEREAAGIPNDSSDDDEEIEEEKREGDQEKGNAKPHKELDSKEQLKDDHQNKDEMLLSLDWTKVPNMLSANSTKYAEDAALRPTVLSVNDVWTRTTKAGLLSPPTVNRAFNVEQQQHQRNKAFDLIDALTKSGVNVLESCSLHVVVCATHCFNSTLLDTIIQDNVNPIEVVERSALIMATTVQQANPIELICSDQEERMHLYSPSLFEANV